MAGVSFIRCPDCGRRHYYRRSCRCQADKGEHRFVLQARVVVTAILLALGCATAVYLAGRYAAGTWGTFRGGLTIYAFQMLGLLLIYGYLYDQYESGQGNVDIRMKWIMPDPIDWWYRIQGLKEFLRNDEIYLKSVIVGVFLGVQCFGGSVVAMRGSGAPQTATLVGSPMRSMTLPVISGGEFSTEDLLGTTSVVLVRGKGSPNSSFIHSWDESKSSNTNPLSLTILVMNQYGDVQEYRHLSPKSSLMRYRSAVGRKWMREWFGNFEGSRLVLVVGPEGRVLKIYEADVSGEEVVAAIIKEFADPAGG